jgi:hypothetical protein
VVEVEDEDHDKYTLSLSIMNFLKSATQAPLMHKYLKNREKLFKQILLKEASFSSPLIQNIPIDIENSLIGKDMGCLLDTLGGSESLLPYCDTSLRVIMRMGDVLMYRHYCHVY